MNSYLFDNGDGKLCTVVRAPNLEDAWRELCECVTRITRLKAAVSEIKQMFVLRKVASVT